VSASGLIYAAIAIMWAAVLIPMWLRNHESASENRSAERFGQAMRVLSRKDAPPPADEDTGDGYRSEPTRAPREPARPRQESPGGPSAAQRFRSTVRARVKQRRTRPKRPPLTLVQRRARTLGVLVGLTAAFALLAVIAPVPWWAPAPFVLLTSAFVVHLRIQALAKQRRRTPGQGRVPSAVAGDAAPGGQPRTVATAAEPAASETGVVQGPSRAVVVERKGDRSRSADPAAEVAPDEADGEAWRPNPLPLPTYVTAPKAVRPIKVIDLTTPGAWSSGRLIDDDVADEDLLAAQVAEEELDALIGEQAAPGAESTDADGRRAVGD
jgi:hypothetical protein